MKDVTIAITAASYSGNKGAAAMLQSSIKQLSNKYGNGLNIKLMSVYPKEDKKQLPFEFIEIVSCKPEQLLFIAFPLAVLYFLFNWILPLKILLKKNKIIKTYTTVDVVLDEAGISFVDSRGIIMNTYAFVSMLVPMLLGRPIIKYSQAIGPFKNPINRLYAKIILPRLKLICARGEITYNNLKSIKVEKNVVLCADGAFSMANDIKAQKAVETICEKDKSFYNDKIIGVSVSSVVEKKCRKMNIDYAKITIDFCNQLILDGYNVLIIANAARVGSDKPRNNDLMICRTVYNGIINKDNCRWYDEEMSAEKIRELISKCKVLVASRFHAMIASLYKNKPVLLVGWSHKYKEVLDMFNLGAYAVDFSLLSKEILYENFNRVIVNEKIIKENIRSCLPTVKASSEKNICEIIKVIDNCLNESYGLFDFHDTEKYIGKNIECRVGYSNQKNIREIAASGGMVTSLLCSLLRNKEIDGAWTTKSYVENGNILYKTGVATSEEQIKSCASSIYMDIPLLKHTEEISKFEGKMAVVLLPCQMSAFSKILEKDQSLKSKVVLKISLYCSGSHSQDATILPLQNAGVSLENANKIIYRNGHWRGQTRVFYKDGTEKQVSYTKTICAYKNAYFFTKSRCMFCQNQYGYDSDLSFGDVWLKEMKNNPIKHTSCIIRTEQGRKLYNIAVKNDDITDRYISKKDIVLSQKRALVFKWNCAKAKKNIKLNTESKCNWNHKLAYRLALINNEYSLKNKENLAKIPNLFIYFYMVFIRLLLSF